MARTALTATKSTRRAPVSASPPSKPTSAQLAQFCDAVRAKYDWHRKILDREEDLGAKWAAEAQLLPSEDIPDAVSVSKVQRALDELKSEARRIRVYDHSVRLDSGIFVERAVDFSLIDADVTAALRYARGAQHAVRAPELRNPSGVYISDDLVPASLHKELVAAFDALADVEPKDFHPGTYGKVQDLIHPSLYPYIADTSPVAPGVARPLHSGGVFTTTRIRAGRTALSSRFAWLPARVRVAADGVNVHIMSRISGLAPRESVPVLYGLIERALALSLPQLEKTLAFEYKHKDSPSVRRWRERAALRSETTRSAWDALRARQRGEAAQERAALKAERDTIEAAAEQESRDRAQFAAADPASPLRGQELKVIIKAANYCLAPGEEYEGTWHMEGMPHERIAASAIYYYDTDPAIADAGLALRRLRDPYADFPHPEQNHTDDLWVNIIDAQGESINATEEDEDAHRDVPSDWEQEAGPDGVPRPMSTGALTSTVALGTVHTTGARAGTGRIVSFPNWVQHRVAGVRNGAGDGGVARRKILCFFVVRDEEVGDREEFPGFAYAGLAGMRVLTTAEVSGQGCAANAPTMCFLLRVACRQKTGLAFPQELAELVVRGAELGVTRESAERTRHELMRDRMPQTRDVLEETYSLCEH